MDFNLQYIVISILAGFIIANVIRYWHADISRFSLKQKYIENKLVGVFWPEHVDKFVFYWLIKLIEIRFLPIYAWR